MFQKPNHQIFKIPNLESYTMYVEYRWSQVFSRLGSR